MKRVGILGGTFNPVHSGHMIVARAALEQYDLDEVLIMTGGNPPHKNSSDILSAEIRHHMVKLAAQDENGLVPFDYEVNKKEQCYTAKTLTELKALNPDTEYYFIIGEDSLRDLQIWYKPEIIVSKCVLLAYPRGRGAGFEQLVEKQRKALGADIRPVMAETFGVSSTVIRERIKAGKSVRYLVPDKVYEYIECNNLYKQGFYDG